MKDLRKEDLMIKRSGFCVLVFSFFICLTGYSAGLGTINGRVIDGFGDSLDGVTIKVLDAKYESTSDSKGNYNISYRPGITKLSFSKNGYTRSIVAVNTSEITDMGVKPVNLWKYPAKGGMYIIGEKHYELINKSSFLAERVGGILRFILNDEPTVVNKRELAILDYEQKNPLVPGKTLYKVYDDNVIGNLGASEFPLITKDDRYIKIVNNIGLRIATLEAGRYFYYTGFMNNRTRMGEGVYFEVKP